MFKNLDIPFNDGVVEQKAAEVIRAHSLETGWVPCLPLPIESIIEHTLDLFIDYDDISEQGRRILAAISPSKRIITLNQAHITEFEKCPGMQRFTLAHEVGHWKLHVDRAAVDHPALLDIPATLVCEEGDDGPCEQVANRFAAFLLMPKDLLSVVLADADVSTQAGFREVADRIGVSYQALHYRLKKLGVHHTA